MVRLRTRKPMFMGLSCLTCLVLILLINATVGGYCFNYCLYNIFGQDVPWYADVAAGLVLGEIVIPVSVVVWIITLCDVPVPLIS